MQRNYMGSLAFDHDSEHLDIWVQFITQFRPYLLIKQTLVYIIGAEMSLSGAPHPNGCQLSPPWAQTFRPDFFLFVGLRSSI